MVSANPTDGGSVSGEGTYHHYQACTVRAIANDGYSFQKWTENGTQVSTNANYFFSVTANRNLVAHFVRGSHIINAVTGSNGSITPSGNVIVNDGGEQTFTITPNQDYEIKDIYIDGSSVGPSSTYTFTNVTEDHRIF